MQHFKDSATGDVWAFEDDVTADNSSGSYVFTAPDGAVLKVPSTLQPYTPPAPTVADQVNAAAADQIGVLQGAFAGAALQPVTDSNGIQWNGGEHSASSMDGAVRLAQNTSASTVDLWDYSNAKHSLSISAAQTVVDAVAGAYQAAFQKWQGLRAQVVALQNMQPRANGTKYSSGAECTDGNGGLWKCTTAGTSGNKKPSWPKSPTTSSTVTDGGVTWTYVSTLEAAIQAVAW